MVLAREKIGGWSQNIVDEDVELIILYTNMILEYKIINFQIIIIPAYVGEILVIY